MKKLIFAIAILICNQNLLAQENKSSVKNDISFNILMTIIGRPELTYERYISENTGIGITAGAAFETPENITIRSFLLPYLRLYFGKKNNSGFYIEANTIFSNLRKTGIDLNYQLYDKRCFTAGFGACLGVKLATKNEYIADIYAGLGRTLGNDLLNIYPRVGLCIGKRF